MDWKTFISNIVGALAWPAVALAVIYVLRHQLPELLKRIKGAAIGSSKIGARRSAARGTRISGIGP